MRDAPDELGRAVLRLFTADDFHRRPEHDEPEIMRRELSQLCLQWKLWAWVIHDELEWLTAAARGIGGGGTATRSAARGRCGCGVLARLPLHPWLARLLVDGDSVGGVVCAAALLSSGQRVQSPDLLRAIDEEWEGGRNRRSTSCGACEAARRWVVIGKAVLSAFPDRVGRRRPGGTVLLSNGRSASRRTPSEFFVAVDIEERSERSFPVIRLACPIEPDWLFDLSVSERSGVEWNKQAERVEAVSALLYDELVIDENRGAHGGR